MSHFLLPERGNRARSPQLDPRYGDEALFLMMSGLSALGVTLKECEAKIFGGGNMFRNSALNSNNTVGRRNGEAARRALAAQGISARSEHLFGDGHRQILFDLADGAVWVRQIAPTELPAALRSKNP